MKHDWRISEDMERDGQLWFCRRCLVRYGPKMTSQKKVRTLLLMEECPGAKP